MVLVAMMLLVFLYPVAAMHVVTRRGRDKLVGLAIVTLAVVLPGTVGVGAILGFPNLRLLLAATFSLAGSVILIVSGLLWTRTPSGRVEPPDLGFALLASLTGYAVGWVITVFFLGLW